MPADAREELVRSIERALDLLAFVPPPDCDRLEQGLRKARRLMRWSADGREVRSHADELVKEVTLLSGVETWRVS